MAKPFALPPGVEPARSRSFATLSSDVPRSRLPEEARVMNLEFQPKTADQIQQVLGEVLATRLKSRPSPPDHPP